MIGHRQNHAAAQPVPRVVQWIVLASLALGDAAWTGRAAEAGAAPAAGRPVAR